MAGSRSPGWPILLILLILGGIIGGWIGQALIKAWPALISFTQTQSIGIPSFTMNLEVLSFTFGFMLHINAFTLLGFILAYLVYRKM